MRELLRKLNERPIWVVVMTQTVLIVCMALKCGATNSERERTHAAEIRRQSARGDQFRDQLWATQDQLHAARVEGERARTELSLTRLRLESTQQSLGLCMATLEDQHGHGRQP